MGLDPPANNSAFVEAKLSPDDMDRLAAIDGVASADRRGWVDVDHPRAGNVTVYGASGPAPPYPVYEGDPAAEVLARGDAMIGPALARRLGLGPGDVLRLPGRHGFADLRVGGVGESPNNLGVMTLIEAGAIGAVGTVLGTVCAAGLQALTYLVSPILTGLQVPLRFDPTAPIVYGGLATVCVIAGSAWPAWRTSRVDSTTALRHE